MTLGRPPTSILKDSGLFLDFDGTLVELAPTPDAIEVGPQVRSLLVRLQSALGGRLALISGRAVADIRGHLHPLELTIGGSHGTELVLANGSRDMPEIPAGLATAVDELERIAASHPGLLVERKPAGVALHYRNAPHLEEECLAEAKRIAGRTGMAVQPGKMVIELKGSIGNKGMAVKSFMEATPFRGSRPVFVGDDLTDEHAFAAAQELGGVGVLVGPERTTAAAFRLDDVTDVRRWLSAGLEDLE